MSTYPPYYIQFFFWLKKKISVNAANNQDQNIFNYNDLIR